jgi:toxin ParE1/3/4
VNQYRITETAKTDFRAVLKQTREQFGPRQRATYKELIVEAVEMVATDPTRGGSWDRGAVVPGLRAFHLEIAAGRRGAAAHILYYGLEQLPKGSLCVVILRLLHDSMEPRLHIARAELSAPPSRSHGADI